MEKIIVPADALETQQRRENLAKRFFDSVLRRFEPPGALPVKVDGRQSVIIDFAVRIEGQPLREMKIYGNHVVRQPRAHESAQRVDVESSLWVGFDVSDQAAFLRRGVAIDGKLPHRNSSMAHPGALTKG